MANLNHFLFTQIGRATIVCLIGVVSILGCKRSDPQKLEEDTKWLKERMLQPDSTKVAILAVRHGISPSVATDVIRTYKSQHDLAYQLIFTDEGQNTEDIQSLLDQGEKGKVLETLSELNQEHGINEKVAASLIYEYLIWSKVSSL